MKTSLQRNKRLTRKKLVKFKVDDISEQDWSIFAESFASYRNNYFRVPRDYRTLRITITYSGFTRLNAVKANSKVVTI